MPPWRIAPTGSSGASWNQPEKHIVDHRPSLFVPVGEVYKSDLDFNILLLGLYQASKGRAGITHQDTRESPVSSVL